MLDTYTAIYNKLQLRCPAASSLLCMDWVSHAFRQIAERRRWSWKVKYGEFLLPALYNTGQVICTNGSPTVTGIATLWNPSLEGRQFRIGLTSPIYTITKVSSPTSLELDLVWGAATAGPINYQIYLAYVTPPADFHSLISVWDPNFNWQLWTNVHQDELNAVDAQRSNIGPSSYLLSARDYTQVYSGIIKPVLQVRGIGNAPSSTSQGQGYSGVNDAIFTVEITFTGVSGTATFQWKKDSGSYTTGVLTDPGPLDLSDGVQVYFPDGGITYTAGDVFIVQTSASISGGLPRYEIWPHKQTEYVYPFLYESRPPDLEDIGATLPRYIRGDVLLEMALASAARWPGPSLDKLNPYYKPDLAIQHDRRSEFMIMELERQDDETMEQDVKYQMCSSLPFAPVPWGDSRWLQSHSI